MMRVRSLFPVILLAGFASPVSAQVAPGQGIPLPPADVGAATTGTFLAQTNPAAAAETNLRVDRLEGEMRGLIGQMEQLMFQMRQLQDEMRRAREDTEFRLRELEGNGVDGFPMESGALPSETAPATEEQLRQALLNSERQLGEGPQTLGTLSVGQGGAAVGATLNGTSGPLDLSSLTLNAAPEVRPQQLSTDVAILSPSANLGPTETYELGYNHVLRGDYGQAISTFGDFIDTYPDDRLRPNAHFWLGESHFAMGAYTPAAEQFLAVFNDYPEDVKVPDSLLKLGMSLERLGADTQACATFNKLLTDYPRAPQIVLDTARTEQGLAGC